VFLCDPPPPTISGKLHMGHLFSYSHMDFVARFQKLQGKEVLYPFCYDNNGLPTEKIAAERGIDEPKMIHAHSEVVSVEYQRMFQKMGMDFDYEHVYSTFSPVAEFLAKKSFEELQVRGYVYRAEKEVFWCPAYHCVVSQSEIDAEGRYERSGAKVETRVMNCWFVDVLTHLDKIREMINEIEWHPDYFKVRLLNWLDNYNQDWCISRQRKYGIRIPDDDDVFDTWFISGMTPQLAWSAKTGKPSLKCPVFDVRFQAHDIIYTWALYTIIKSFYHNNQIPWRHIVVSGHALTNEGSKMSKSKGQNVPPRELLEDYGADAIRFWAAHAQPGNDAQIDFDVMRKGNRLLSKIRNAKRYLDLNPNEGENQDFRRDWLHAKDYIDLQLGTYYNWSNALTHLVAFFWKAFCDKFIEESKKTPSTRTLQGIFDEMVDYFEIFLPNVRDHLT